MKAKFIILFFFLSLVSVSLLKAQCYSSDFKEKFPKWKEEKYEAANTAKDIPYLKEEEKLFYYYLNLLRMNPSLFSKTFMESCKFSFLHEERERMRIASLLKKVKPLDPIFPQKVGCQYRNCENKTNGKYVFGDGGYQRSMLMTYHYKPVYSDKNSSERYAFQKVVDFFSDEATRKYILSEKIIFTVAFEEQDDEKTKKQQFYFKVFSNAEAFFLPFHNLDKDSLLHYTNHKENFELVEPQWKEPRYDSANTAKGINYLTENEKLVYYYLNLARMNPPLFAETFLKKYTVWNANESDGLLYSKHVDIEDDTKLYSLYATLSNISPSSPIYPDKKLHESAKCHAISSGKAGTIGSERIKGSKCPKIKYEVTFYYDDNVTMTSSSSKSTRQVECYAYQETDALNIVMQILASKNLSNNSQRTVLLDKQYKKLGVAIARHSKYGYGAILDFE
jgi:hypothetical protein